MKASVVSRPAGQRTHAHYLANRAPLAPSHLLKLPLGQVQPEGWLRHQLGLMAKGMTGRLGELSAFLAPDNGWLGGDKEGWEEQGYWLRGFYDLAVLTGDPALLGEAGRWVEAILGSQDREGYFGARAHARRIPGWTLEQETVQELRQSPVRSTEPEEQITLIPLGCARLRMACLPVIGEDEEAGEWT